MILADKDLLGALNMKKGIDISPPPEAAQIQPASIDLRLGGELYDTYRDELYEAQPGETLTVKPWTFYLGTTLDTLGLSNRLAAQLTGRSSFGRKGLVVHKTAGWCDPGWEGQLTLEMFNFSLEPIEVEVGERICQIRVMKTASESGGYKGEYQGQEGPTLSKHEDGEAE